MAITWDADGVTFDTGPSYEYRTYQNTMSFGTSTDSGNKYDVFKYNTSTLLEDTFYTNPVSEPIWVSLSFKSGKQAAQLGGGSFAIFVTHPNVTGQGAGYWQVLFSQTGIFTYDPTPAGQYYGTASFFLPPLGKFRWTGSGVYVPTAVDFSILDGYNYT